MDYGKALITDFLDPDEVSRGVRDRIARGEPFDVYLAREGYRRIIPDIPYYEYVPFFSVVKAFGITGEKIRLLYDLYLKCNVYKNKSPQYADLISFEEKKNHVGLIEASFYVSMIMHNAQAISESNAWALVRTLRENISIVLTGYILKEELYAYMAAVGEQQVTSADGLPMTSTQPQMVINNVAQAYAQIAPPTPSPIIAASTSATRPCATANEGEGERTPTEPSSVNEEYQASKQAMLEKAKRAVEDLRKKGHPPEEIARHIDDIFTSPKFSNAALGKLIPANPRVPVGTEAARSRGKRLRGKK